MPVTHPVLAFWGAEKQLSVGQRLGHALLQACMIPAVCTDLDLTSCVFWSRPPLHPCPLHVGSSSCPELNRKVGLGGEKGLSPHSKLAHPRGHTGPAGW